MAMMVNRDAPLGGLSSLMALKGREGDTELVHMSKPEVRSLQSLGQLSVNPSTGLPEAKGLQSILPLIAGTAASFFLPALAPSIFGSAGAFGALGGAAAGALGSGVGSLLAGQSMDKALFGAALSFGLGSIMGAEPFGNLGADAATGAAEGAAGAGLQDVAGFTPASSYANAPISVESLGGLNPLAQASYNAEAAAMGLSPSPSYNPAEAFARDAGVAIDPSLQTAASTRPDFLGRLTQRNFTDQSGNTFFGKQAEEMAKTAGKETSASFGKTALLPLGVGLAGLASPEPVPYQSPQTQAYEPRRQTLSGGETLAPVATQESALDIALGRSPARNQLAPYTYAKTGGLIRLNEGGMPMEQEGVEEGSPEYFEGRVRGNGDGMSDEVEFEVEGEDPDMAMLSRDEYVLPADVVAIIGNGSSEAGANKIDMFIKQARKEAFGTEKQQKETKGDGGLASLVA